MRFGLSKTHTHTKHRMQNATKEGYIILRILILTEVEIITSLILQHRQSLFFLIKL